MIEIKCNKAEKRRIIDGLVRMRLPCLFPRKSRYCTNDPFMTCQKCIEQNIKWEVTNEFEKQTP